ncbi:hypothetical protein SRHO_G00128310 [Serrasalmus rhombeus]
MALLVVEFDGPALDSGVLLHIPRKRCIQCLTSHFMMYHFHLLSTLMLRGALDNLRECTLTADVEKWEGEKKKVEKVWEIELEVNVQDKAVMEELEELESVWELIRDPVSCDEGERQDVVRASSGGHSETQADAGAAETSDPNPESEHEHEDPEEGSRGEKKKGGLKG